MESVRILLSIAAAEDLELLHFDIRTAFLHGIVEEDIYMSQPEGFEKGDLVCKLNKCIYGLKQASYAWNKHFSDFLNLFGLMQLKKDNCVFVNKSGKVDLIIALYVDDGLVVARDRNLLAQVISYLRSKFDISIMDPKCFVGIQIYRDRANRKMLINQEYYIKKVVDRFGMAEAKTASTPLDVNQKLNLNGCPDNEEHGVVRVPYKEAIGSLLYTAQATRPDISFAVSFLARFSEKPKLAHWNAVKRVIRYLKEQPDLGIVYQGNGNENELIAFSDSDYGGNLDTRHSTSGYLILFNCGPVIWKSQKQKTIAQSTTEAEFIAAAMCCKEVLWARHLVCELGRKKMKPTKLFIDNQSAITIIRNNQIHGKTKHIQIKYMFIQEVNQLKEVEVEYIESKEQRADIMTKPISVGQFRFLKTTIQLAAVAAFCSYCNFVCAEPKTSQYGVILGILNPCQDIWKVPHDQEVSYYWNFRYYVDRECLKIYNEEWGNVVKEMSTCNNEHRVKRGIINSFVKKFFKIAVTNLLHVVELADSEPTLQTFYNQYDIAKHYLEDRHDYLQICSPTATQHRKEMLLESTSFPPLFWAIAKVHGEILANTANLKKIIEKCKSNRMATKELGELVNDPDITGIPEDRTGEVKIEGRNDGVVTFRFHVYEDNENNLSIYVYGTFGAISLIILLCTGGFFLGKFFWWKESKVENPIKLEETERESKKKEVDRTYDIPVE